MRVFVTGTGRCGSVSFAAACSHITNYTSAHETPNPDLEYPDNHIEVNPHIRCCIPTIASKYRDAKWVHLVREAESCIKSLAALDEGNIMRAYRALYPSIMPSEDPLDVADRYYRFENNVIINQLALTVSFGKITVMHLEDIKENWWSFWNWIGAEGDFEASLSSWNIKRNTTEQREAHRKAKEQEVNDDSNLDVLGGSDAGIHLPVPGIGSEDSIPM